GGLISSTAVTLTFSRQSRDQPKRAASLALGVIGACTVLLPRLFGLTVALEVSDLGRLCTIYEWTVEALLDRTRR
ncbi:MAG: DUF4010 domain-containing protein, partial [Chthoniobacteraceae bacterium]